MRQFQPPATQSHPRSVRHTMSITPCVNFAIAQSFASFHFEDRKVTLLRGFPIAKLKNPSIRHGSARQLSSIIPNFVPAVGNENSFSNKLSRRWPDRDVRERRNIIAM